jgi:hypothetical protein
MLPLIVLVDGGHLILGVRKLLLDQVCVIPALCTGENRALLILRGSLSIEHLVLVPVT